MTTSPFAPTWFAACAALAVLSAAAPGLLGCTMATDGGRDEQSIILAKATADIYAPYRFPNVGQVTSSKGGCSGTVINEITILTAAHCVTTFGSRPVVADPEEVTFDWMPEGYVADPSTRQYAISAVHVPSGYLESGGTADDLDVALLIIDIARSGGHSLPLHAVRSPHVIEVAGFTVRWPNVTFEEAGVGTVIEGEPNSIRNYAIADFLGVVEDVPDSGAFNLIETAPIACYGDSGGPLFAYFCPDGEGGLLANCTESDPHRMEYQVGVASHLTTPYETAPCSARNTRFASTAWNDGWLTEVLASYGRQPYNPNPPACTAATCCNGVRPLDYSCSGGRRWQCINPSGVATPPAAGAEGPLSPSQWLPAGSC